MAAQIILVFIACFTLTLGLTRFTPVAYNLSSAPELTGALLPNTGLTNSETMHYKLLSGAASFAFLNGNVYTVTSDRKVLNVATCPPTLVSDLTPASCILPWECGALTSIRVGINGQLLVLDAYRGLFEVNPVTGGNRLLFSQKTKVDGRRPRYLSDMVQTPDGTIYIADASDKYDYYDELYIILDGRRSGRILALNTTGGIEEYLREIFGYPNGLELTPDGKHLLLAESGRARIYKINLDPAVWPRAVLFADNLPGCPTNIRRSSDGTFWVGMSLIRHSGIANTMDDTSDRPQDRIVTYTSKSIPEIRSLFPNYGLVLQLDSNGTIIRSLHDQSGSTYPSVSEAIAHDGLLYVGSTETSFVGRIVLIPDTELSPETVLELRRSRCLITEEQYRSSMKQQQKSTNSAPVVSNINLPNAAANTESGSSEADPADETADLNRI